MKKEWLVKLAKSFELYFVVLFVMLELLFHFARFGLTFDALPLKLTFAGFFGLFFGLIVGLLPKLASKIAGFVVTFLACAFFIAQTIFSCVFQTFLSLWGMGGVANQALDYLDVVFEAVMMEWFILLPMLLPIILYWVLAKKWFTFERHSKLGIANSVGFTSVFISAAYLIMLVTNNDEYSAYVVHEEFTSIDMAVEKMGVLESFYLDTRFAITGQEHEFVAEGGGAMDQPQTPATEELGTESTEAGELVEKIDTSPNVCDIDFAKLIENESDEDIVSLHEYIQTVAPTNKNEYTGMFEGYNLIFIVAEGFSGYCIDPERTPTLYKLSTEGFVFENYYTPLWYGSTLGGEFADLTGMMPKNGGALSLKTVGEEGKSMPFTLGNQLKKLGYKVTGYHDNSHTYYGRNNSHPLLGYEWIGTGAGYEPEKNASGSNLWPQSDLYMMEQTVPQYVSEEPFHTYYLTVSGHVPYNYVGNTMCVKHRDLVKDLPYEETTQAYISCQYELEYALDSLVKQLEAAGIADKTLIVLTADHVPYENKEVLDDLAGYTLGDTFEWYENTLIVWSASMEEPIPVSKYCSSLDVLPTISNLMGIEYDSRMMVGRDILSTSEGIVMFDDRSFITDRCSYDSGTKEVVSFDGSEITEEYLKEVKGYVKNKFNLAYKIMDTDYYKYIKDELK